MSERPYPEGIAWDEAWRERKRADRLVGIVRMLIGCVEDTKKYPDMHDDFVEELESARIALENQYDND